jgi:hypothetical protein
MSGFSFTNTTASGEKVNPICLDVVTDYAKTADEPTMARLSNKTASMEQPEVITYRSDKVNTVSTSIAVRNPSPVKDGVMYTVKLETVYRNDSGAVPIDEPVVAWLSIKHPSSDIWDNSKVSLIVNRLLSACLKGQTASGTGAVSADDWRFEDLMRSALVPTED